MKSAWFKVFAVAGALVASSGVLAQAVEKEEQFDSSKSYLLFQLDPIIEEESGKPLQRAHAVLARYDAVHEDIRGGGRAAANPVPESEVLRVQARKDELEKDGKQRLYLLEVKPDVWTIEATGISMGGATPEMTTSFSLGSYHFEVLPGQIVDLGVLTPVRPASDNPDTKLSAGKVLKAMFLPVGLKIEQVPLTMTVRERGAEDIALPEWLARHQPVKARLTYGSRFGNYAGGLINRIDGEAGRARVGESETPKTEPDAAGAEATPETAE